MPTPINARRLHVQTTVIMAVLMLAVFLLTACTPLGEPPTPEPEPTMRITFPSSYAVVFLEGKDRKNAPDAARDLKSLGDKYYTDAIANPDGSITAILTQRQRDNLIARIDASISAYAESFTKSSPDYRYVVNDDYTRLDVWTDRNISFAASSFYTLMPSGYGYKYYLEGRTGEWSMTVTLRNCHTGKITVQYQAGDDVHYPVDQLGE